MTKSRKRWMIRGGAALAALCGMGFYAHSSDLETISISARAGDAIVRYLHCNDPRSAPNSVSYDTESGTLAVKCSCEAPELVAAHYEQIRLSRPMTLLSIIPVGWTRNTWSSAQYWCRATRHSIDRRALGDVSDFEFEYAVDLIWKDRDVSEEALSDWFKEAQREAKEAVAKSRRESPEGSADVFHVWRTLSKPIDLEQQSIIPD